MGNLQKIGGIAAVLWAILLIWATVHLTVILPSQGFASPEELYDPTKGMSYLIDAPFLTIEYFLTLLYAVVIALMVLAVSEQLKSSAQGLINFAFMFGLSTVALNLAEGVVGLFGRSVVMSAKASNLETLDGLYQAIMTVHDALLFAGLFSVGVWIVSISWASLQSARLPKGLSYLGLLAGIQAMGAVVFPPLSLPVLPLIWSIWLGIVLLRSSIVS